MYAVALRHFEYRWREAIISDDTRSADRIVNFLEIVDDKNWTRKWHTRRTVSGKITLLSPLFFLLFKKEYFMILRYTWIRAPSVLTDEVCGVVVRQQRQPYRAEKSADIRCRAVICHLTAAQQEQLAETVEHPGTRLVHRHHDALAFLLCVLLQPRDQCLCWVRVESARGFLKLRYRRRGVIDLGKLSTKLSIQKGSI